QRRIGKTSVLQKFENTLQEKKHRVVNFDLMGKAKEPFGEVWAELEKRIRDQFNQSGSHSGQPPFLDWLSTTLSEDNKNSSLVLLLDEFDALEEWEQPEDQQAINKLFPQLRNLLNKYKNFKCVFTIGRDPKHLSSKTFSQLEGIEQRKISLLEEGQVVQLINLSKGVLNWTPEAIKEVERLTNGQAYCVQLLCSQIWDCFYSEDRPTISLQSVETVIPKILSPDIFKDDIWDGLSAAGKVIASILSEFDEGATIEQLLKETQTKGGIASVLQEQLEKVPPSLVALDFIELVKGQKYKFRIELVRQYVKRFKSFDDMQQELDRPTDHVADEYYQLAYKLVHQHRKYDDAIPLLRKAIEGNPRHIKANRLLAQVFHDQRKLEEAHETLKEFSKFNPRAAKSWLITVRLALAEQSEKDKDKLKFYNEILQLDPKHPEAKKQQKEIQAQIEAKRRLPWELAKGFVLTYQKRIAQVMAVVISLGISYIWSVDFPPGLLFEIGKTNNNEYLLTSVPSSESHSLVFLQIAIDKPNVQLKKATFKFEIYKSVALTPLADTETPTYQIGSALLKSKGDTFQYPFFEQDKPTPLPFVFTFQFENDMTQEPEFTCKTDAPKIGCEVKLKGYASLLRGIPWWIKGSLFGLLLVVLIWVGYAIKDRERDDIL
ncbi:MAG: hypothetical protein BWK78_05570, partial [Thiotrichaceae bacterium IS1]